MKKESRVAQKGIESERADQTKIADRPRDEVRQAPADGQETAFRASEQAKIAGGTVMRPVCDHKQLVEKAIQ